MNIKDYSELANVKWDNWVKERGIQLFALEPDLDKFIELGRKEVELFLDPSKSNFQLHNDPLIKDYKFAQPVQSYFTEPLSELNMLEFGCGAGRLLLNFAKSFNFVYGYDISDNAINLANDIFLKYNIRNSLKFSGDSVKQHFEMNIKNKGSFVNFVFSYIVFQHISNKETIEQSFRDIVSILKPGGIAKLHVRLTNDCYSNEADCFAGWGLPKEQAMKFYRDLCESLNVEVLDFTNDGYHLNNAGFITFRKGNI